MKMEVSARQADFPGLPYCHFSKMAGGALPTCVQTNQLWPKDSRSYHICESQTTFLVFPSALPAWPAVWGMGAGACLLLGYTFPAPLYLPVYHHSALGEALLSCVQTGQMNTPRPPEAAACRKTCAAAGLRTAEPADQHPATVSFPNTH